jgi:FkbM family methyltransferase
MMNALTTTEKIKKKLKEKGVLGLAKAVANKLFVSKQVEMDENALILKLFSSKPDGVMIDVGACLGHTLIPFADIGWKIFAFEPDPKNRSELQKIVGTLRNVLVFSEAITELDDQELKFYGSAESIGISSLSKFTTNHVEIAKVKTQRLDTFIAKQKITNVDYLKIDAEGHDLFVLKSFPFAKHAPKIVLCEFEDKKTIPLGYNVIDMVKFLEGNGYKVVVSEWHPIERYGVSHKWKGFAANAAQVPAAGWGNLIAFKDENLIEKARAQLNFPL